MGHLRLRVQLSIDIRWSYCPSALLFGWNDTREERNAVCLFSSKSFLKHPWMELYQRFIFKSFSDLITAFYTGVPLRGEICFPRIGIIIADQPEERILMCVKRRDSFLHCSHCILSSRVQSTSAPRSLSAERVLSSFIWTSYEDAPSVRRSRKTCPNITIQLSPITYPQLNVTEPLGHQLSLGIQNRTRTIDVSNVSVYRRV